MTLSVPAIDAVAAIAVQQLRPLYPSLHAKCAFHASHRLQLIRPETLRVPCATTQLIVSNPRLICIMLASTLTCLLASDKCTHVRFAQFDRDS